MSNVPRPSTGDYRSPGGLESVSRSSVARRFFALATLVGLGAVGLAVALIATLGRPPADGLQFPAAFVVTTLLLAIGSRDLQQALRAIRRERQDRFRNRLQWTLGTAGLFMGTQTYALWTIMPAERTSETASLGVAPFVIMLAVLHGLHFFVATLFVSYVTVQARAGRYDHEYHWGVTVCTWFWHALGLVWTAVLAVYLIAFR